MNSYGVLQGGQQKGWAQTEHHSAFSIIPRVLSTKHRTALSIIPRVLRAEHRTAFSVTHSSDCLLHHLEEEACPRNKRRGKVGETFPFCLLKTQQSTWNASKSQREENYSFLFSWKLEKEEELKSVAFPPLGGSGWPDLTDDGIKLLLLFPTREDFSDSRTRKQNIFIFQKPFFKWTSDSLPGLMKASSVTVQAGRGNTHL